MKNITFYVILLIITLHYLPAGAQKYDPKNGTTTYPNGTVYRPAHQANGSQFDVVETDHVGSDAKGVTTRTRKVIYCQENPDACKEALEEAADDAASREPQNFKDGCGSLDEWLSRPGAWPGLPPIFFPERGPGIPISPGDIGPHTHRIIRGIR